MKVSAASSGSSNCSTPRDRHRSRYRTKTGNVASRPDSLSMRARVGAVRASDRAVDRHRALAQQQTRERVAEIGERRLDRRIALEMLRDHATDRVGVPLDDGLKQPRLVAEPGVQRFLRSRGAPGHLEHRGIAVAVFRQRGHGHVENAIAPPGAGRLLHSAVSRKPMVDETVPDGTVLSTVLVGTDNWGDIGCPIGLVRPLPLPIGGEATSRRFSSGRVGR